MVYVIKIVEQKVKQVFTKQQWDDKSRAEDYRDFIKPEILRKTEMEKKIKINTKVHTAWSHFYLVEKGNRCGNKTGKWSMELSHTYKHELQLEMYMLKNCHLRFWDCKDQSFREQKNFQCFGRITASKSNTIWVF